MLSLILNARETVLSGKDLSREDALALARVPTELIPYLAAAANEVRLKYAGNAIESCALSNIKSGNCSEDCKFCAQSGHYKTDAPVYPQISVDEIVSQGKAAEAMGATEFCLVSSGWGATNEAEFEKIVESVRRLKQETTLFIDASLGFLRPDQVERLKEAGLFRNNHNLEAAKGFFDKICSTHTYQQRASHVEMVRHYGIHPCSGGILGMGESIEDRIDLALELKRLKADCVPINILNPRRGTPLGDVEPLSPMEIIRYIAIFRLILPSSTLKIAGGREVNLRDLQAMAMQAGANGLILGNYLTTMGRSPARDLEMLRDLGFEGVPAGVPVEAASNGACCS